MRSRRLLLVVGLLVVTPILTWLVLVEMPCHDTATWEALNGRYVGHWQIALGEGRRFPALVAGHEDLRIDRVGDDAIGQGINRSLVVSWNGVPYRAEATHGGIGVSILYDEPSAAPVAAPAVRSDGFSLNMLTLQFDGLLPLLESIEVDDPDYDHLFVDFRAGEFAMTGLETDCVRYVCADS